MTNQPIWQDKLHASMDAEIKHLPQAFADIPADSTMLVPTPLMIDEYINNIPFGDHVDFSEMRDDLASDYEAEYTDPVTCRIYLRIVAEAAYEAFEFGEDIESITPFWRVVDVNMPLSRNLSCGLGFIQTRRQDEGLH